MENPRITRKRELIKNLNQAIENTKNADDKIYYRNCINRLIREIKEITLCQ